MILDGKSSQEYPVNVGVPQVLILGPIFFPTIHWWPTWWCYLYCKCDQASDLWHQLELASELESDLQDTVALVISTLEKLNWFHLTALITMVLLMWKWMGLFWRKNRLWRCWAVPYPELFWSWYTGLGSQIQTPKFLKMIA